MVPAHTGLRKRLIVFPLLGAGIGIAFATWALVAGGLALAMRTPIHLPLPLLLAYPVSGLLSGVIVALAFPLVRWLGGALVVGVLAMFPLYFFVSLAIDPLSLIDIEVAGAAAVFVGGIVGVRAWMEEHRRANRLAHVWLFAVASSVVAWSIGQHWAGQWPAYLAIFLFLIPVSLAVLVSMDKRLRREPVNQDRAA